MKEIIEHNLREKLNNFSIQQGSEQRTVGDLIEHQIREICKDLSKSNNFTFVDRRSKKSLEDFTLETVENSSKHIYYFDPKTHDVNADFSMPNLSSIEKLKKLCESNNEDLINIFVSYSIIDNMVNILSIEVKYIWELDFSILRIGSLGKGQLQISNMKNGLTFTNEGKSTWFENLKKLARSYHDDRIKMIEKDRKKWL